MHKNLAHGLLWLVGLSPALAACFSLPQGSFHEVSATLGSLGRLTGIAGLGLMLVAAIVSVRIPGFDRCFGGLTSLWRTHHQLGAAAFLLLLAHPLLLSLAAVEISLATAVAVLFPPLSVASVWLGWGALVLMMVFLAPSFSFFGRPDYQRWKRLHHLSGVAVVLALAHTLMLARTLPAPWGRWLWVGFALAATLTLTYALVFSRRSHRYDYRVEGVARPANNVVEISLTPAGERLDYRPGQFVYLSPYDRELASGYAEEHPYTLSSAPGEPGLRVTIKDLGDASRAIQRIRPGSAVKVTGPYGAFFPDQARDRELWIAGGIGITPFLSRARHLANLGDAVDIGLIYCVQDEPRALFAEELRQLAAAIPGFTLTLHYFYQEGPLSADFVRYHCRDCAERRVYVCGPGPLLKLAKSVVVANGVARQHFHSEEFDLL